MTMLLLTCTSEVLMSATLDLVKVKRRLVLVQSVQMTSSCMNHLQFSRKSKSFFNNFYIHHSSNCQNDFRKERQFRILEQATGWYCQNYCISTRVVLLLHRNGETYYTWLSPCAMCSSGIGRSEMTTVRVRGSRGQEGIPMRVRKDKYYQHRLKNYKEYRLRVYVRINITNIQ